MIVVVPTVAARARASEELLRELRAQLPGADVVALLSTGDTRRDAVQPFAWGAESAARWVVHVEDDAWPAPDFGARLRARLAATTADAVTLFSRASAHRAPGVYAVRAISMSVALAVRRSVLDGFASWAPSWYAAHPEHHHATDLLVSAWLRRCGARVEVVSPSLVQHREGPSTFRGRARRRQSESYRDAYGEAPCLPSPC